MKGTYFAVASKTIAHALSIVACLGISGCSSSSVPLGAQSYNFTNFGTMPLLEGTVGNDSQITTADFNGDGKPDVVIFDTLHNHLTFYENKMPRVSLTNALENPFR